MGLTCMVSLKIEKVIKYKFISSFFLYYEQIDFSAFFVTDRELSNLKGRSVPHTPWKIWIVICTMEMKTEFVEHFIFRGNAFRARNREEFRNCTMSERTKHGKKKSCQCQFWISQAITKLLCFFVVPSIRSLITWLIFDLFNMQSR